MKTTWEEEISIARGLLASAECTLHNEHRYLRNFDEQEQALLARLKKVQVARDEFEASVVKARAQLPSLRESLNRLVKNAAVEEKLAPAAERLAKLQAQVARLQAQVDAEAEA